MSGFPVSWLDLREPADFAARAKPLAADAVAWLQACDNSGIEPIVVDLGAGTGSTLRALSRLGAGRLVWRLVDRDGRLLDEAIRRHANRYLLEDYQADLNVVTELPLGGARLVCASALFDLASRDFVERLVSRLAQHGAGLYAALTYDGTTEWQPAHPLDEAVLAAFNEDQRRDKGLGPALGPDASSCLRENLERAGYRVRLAASPWLLTAQEAELVRELARGIARAVAEGYGLAEQDLQDWLAFRLAHADKGSCRVGHRDLLALPTATAR